MTALAGNYVNFGVFELYGDRALSDALDVALKMTLSIPLADILAFRKVCELLFSTGLAGNYVNFAALNCSTLYIYVTCNCLKHRVFTIVNMMFSLFNITLITYQYIYIYICVLVCRYFFCI